jgi:hypothetical protein
VLQGTYALEMTDAELALFRSVAQRDPPKTQVRELFVVAERRAGKDSIASLCVAYAAIQNYAGAGLLRPGEAASVLCLAVDRVQARIIHSYSKAYFDRISALKPLVKRETNDGFELSTGAEVSILASNFRSVRGRAVAFAVLDECAYMRSEESATNDIELYNALLPGMATLPRSMLIGISSPYKRSGLLYEKWRQNFGKPSDEVLVIQVPSRVLNPTLPQSVVHEAMAADPAVARAEWMAQWRDDVASYLPRDLIEAAVDEGVAVRPPRPGVVYQCAADPSGGASDSFACAVSHSEGRNIVLDCLIEIPRAIQSVAGNKYHSPDGQTISEFDNSFR